MDAELDGISVVDDPPFTHNYAHGHPAIRFDGVEVGEDALIGGLGGGDDLQRAWFTEERLGVAARGVGSMWRLIEETTAWALEREQGGARSWTTRACRSRSPTRPPTPPPDGS